MASTGEMKEEFAEMMKELEEDKCEMQEGTIEGAAQWQKEVLLTHQISIGAGVVMAGVGGILFYNPKKLREHRYTPPNNIEVSCNLEGTKRQYLCIVL